MDISQPIFIFLFFLFLLASVPGNVQGALDFRAMITMGVVFPNETDWSLVEHIVILRHSCAVVVGVVPCLPYEIVAPIKNLEGGFREMYAELSIDRGLAVFGLVVSNLRLLLGSRSRSTVL